MAHLNLVKIHPWRDGNGWMSRCLHTRALTRGGVFAPEFSSIEEWLGVGRNTYAYYDALGEIGGQPWQPDNDTSKWIRFCLSAHHQQAQLVRQRLDQAAHLWELLDTWVRRNGLPERVVSALHLAAYRGPSTPHPLSTRREPHRRPSNRDLRALVRADMLEQHGETRGRFYLTSPTLMRVPRPIQQRVRLPPVQRPHIPRRRRPHSRPTSLESKPTPPTSLSRRYASAYRCGKSNDVRRTLSCFITNSNNGRSTRPASRAASRACSTRFACDGT